MQKYFLILITFLLISCSDNTNEQYPKNLFSVIQEGETVESTYTFCSIVAQEVEYTYRIGLWIFKSREGKIIAKGEYDTKTIIIDDYGGCACPFSYVINTVDINKWEFWNSKGEKIEPTQRLISLVNLELEKFNKH